MNRMLLLGVATFALLSTCAAQFRPCKFTEASTIGRGGTVTVRRLSVIEPGGEVGASVFIPESNEPLPGIVFSHSEIHGPSNDADLLRFAWTLARAGAASIILDGAIEWKTPNDKSARDPHLMACAGQWLLLHAKLDRNRLAHAGPSGGWGGGNTPFCMAGESPCWIGRAWLNFGQASPAEWRNTEDLLTLQGQLGMAQFAQRALNLREINSEWLNDPGYGAPK
jgi:hypothetical protein